MKVPRIKMLSIALLILVMLGSNQGRSQSVESTFMHLACQQCRTMCPTQQSNPEGPPRVGKAGPRGLPGPVGEPGKVNLTEMEQMVDTKIKEAVDLLSIRSCRKFQQTSAESINGTGGPFEIFIPDLGLKEVYCDVRTDGGYWIVFQRRMDGSEDFYRSWNDYVNGFGSTIREFWLGLEAIHQLTRSGTYELRIDMIELDGTHYYAKYSSFKVGPASDEYRLRVSGYSGNATDAFANPSTSADVSNNMAFTARDRDNDLWGSNCAEVYKGGWWYHACHWSNLNGLYEARNTEGMRWFNGRGDFFMKFTEMKFRLKQ